MAKVSGTIRNSAGGPAAGARVVLRARDGFGGFYRGQPPSGPDGGFTIPNVPPGDYVVDANPGNMRTNAGESFETGSLAVTVAGRDVSDLVITMTTGATVAGRVIYDSTSTQNRPDRVRPQPADPRTPFRFGPDDGAVRFGPPISAAWALGWHVVSHRHEHTSSVEGACGRSSR